MIYFGEDLCLYLEPQLQHKGNFVSQYFLKILEQVFTIVLRQDLNPSYRRQYLQVAFLHQPIILYHHLQALSLLYIVPNKLSLKLCDQARLMHHLSNLKHG